MKLALHNLYTHFLFITEEKNPTITGQLREPLEHYITKIVRHNNCGMCAIYANPEHVHFLIERSPCISEEAIATMVASASSRFINTKLLQNGKFSWQYHASAFSVSLMEIDEVCRFILFQPDFHQEISFEQEYSEFFIYYQRTINLG